MKPTSTLNRLRPLWAILCLLLSVSVLLGQGAVGDIRLLSSVTESNPAPAPPADSLSLEAAADSLSPGVRALAVLAAYAVDTEEGVAALAATPADILRLYATNDYVAPLLRDSALLRALAEVEADELTAAVRQIRSGARERLLQQLNSNDLYAASLQNALPVLRSAYQTPQLQEVEALSLAAQEARQAQRTGMLPPTEVLLVGLSDWIAKRAQEEFMIVFLDRMIDQLHSTNLQYLFPQSSRFLSGLEVTNYRSILIDARQAFQSDLMSMGLNAATFFRQTGDMGVQSDPLLYNFLLVFRLVELSAREVPLVDLLPYARAELQARRFDMERTVNYQLAAGHEQPLYRQLQAEVDTANSRLIDLYDNLKTLERNLIDTFSLNIGTLMLHDIGALQDLNARRQDLRSVRYNVLFRDDDGRYFTEISELLQGRPDYEQMRSLPDPDAFDRLFGSEPSPDTLRALGLTLVRRLLTRTDDHYHVVGELQRYLGNLRNFQRDLNRHLYAADPDRFERDAAVVEQQRTELDELLEAEIAFYSEQENVSRHDLEALRYLQKMSGTFAYVDSVDLSPEEELALRRQYLTANYQLLQRQADRLADRYERPAPSPALAYFRQAPPADPLRAELQEAEAALQDVDRALLQLDTSLAAAPYRSYANAALYQQVTEAATQLLYFLMKDDSTFVTPNELLEVFNDNYDRQFFLGLLYQRIRNLDAFGEVSPDGLGHIATTAVQALADLQTVLAMPDSLRGGSFVAKLEFATTTLNAILETPLFQGHLPGDELAALIDLNPGFGPVPEAARQLTEIFQDVDRRNYRFALENMVNLLDLLYPVPGSQRRERLENRLQDINRQMTLVRDTLVRGHTRLSAARQSELQRELRDLNRNLDRQRSRLSRLESGAADRRRNQIITYGNLMAGVVAAETPDDIGAVLQAVAVPRGHSQAKRRYSPVIGLNAYFGGTFGYESLAADSIGSDPELNTFGLWVPVGLSASVRPSPRSGFSISAFLPIIDLGAVTAYRTDAAAGDAGGLPKLSFRNVISPGFHLLANFGKTPFFLGAGVQYGPELRRINELDDFTQVQATRYMITFGIDVPIIDFYRGR